MIRHALLLLALAACGSNEPNDTRPSSSSSGAGSAHVAATVTAKGEPPPACDGAADPTMA